MNLEEFFHSINLKTLQGFIESGREEDLHLDFKLAPKGMTTDTKKNFAKALSGFANSDGGIIVWGVNARKNAQEIDVADKLEPISNLLKFINELNSYTGQFVTPIVDNVLHKAISLPDRNTHGFAISLIPVSDIGPHMAMAGEFRYYKRSGDSFYKLEHFDVADLFGKRPKPFLQINTRLSPAGSRGSEKQIDVVIGIENKGRGIARAPFLSIHVQPPHHVSKFGIDGNYGFGLDRLINARDTNEKLYGASPNIVIHPGVTIDVTAVRINIKTEKSPHDIFDLIIDYKLAADGLQLTDGQIKIDGTDLWNSAFN